MANKMVNQGKNSEIIQQQNRLLILRLIRERGTVSRVGLAEITGLKQATITNIINELIERDYVKETGLIEGANGRRVKGLALNGEKMRILVARLTTDYYAVGIYDLLGNCIKAEKKYWKETVSFEEQIKEVRNDLIFYRDKQARGKQVIGTGIALQGNICRDLALLDGAEDLESFLTAYYTKELGMDVYVDNTSNMSAYLEWERLTSSKAEIHTLLCLIISYSVDCAVICDGKVLHGRNGRAGHFGHVSIDMSGPLCECGNRGCIKNYISVDAVKKRCEELMPAFQESVLYQKEYNIRDLINAYYKKDVLARAVYNEIAEKIGVILANLINQFNPEEIILGDEIPNNNEFLNLVRTYTNRRLPKERAQRVEITVFSEERKTENDVGMKGMSLYVINEQLKTMKLK